MSQDVLLGATLTVTQADLPLLRTAGRLGKYPVVFRVERCQLGGGFGDQDNHPFAWGLCLVKTSSTLTNVRVQDRRPAEPGAENQGFPRRMRF